MPEVKFYKKTEEKNFKFAVIFAKYKGKWVFCKHKERDTYELPGGHREPGEEIDEAAGRELHEETGAIDFAIRRICAYSVTENGEETFGMLYFADVRTFEKELHSEIEKIIITDEMPTEWTYPLIQPLILGKVKELGLL
ncbi:NUDIX hydrolase [Konateibacter massiliensis]|uniref:NUDIX hydrolase n=1 Tax=Konateibacter massiliensis TaxID=2002841 RepID=UPI000C15407D|nr:NUDIX domain-containing protein [Konateibacter massiliensis]